MWEFVYRHRFFMMGLWMAVITTLCHVPLWKAFLISTPALVGWLWSEEDYS